MTIPSTKASTNNVDQGSDSISLARPDIKQNIDNVNEIIDHLGTTDQVPATLTSSIGAGDVSEYWETVSGNTRRRAFTAINDDDSVVSTIDDSAGLYFQITLPAGTYRARWLTAYSTASDDIAQVTFYNVTDDESIVSTSGIEVGTTNQTLFVETASGFTIDGTKTFEWRFTAAIPTANDLTSTIRIEITRYR